MTSKWEQIAETIEPEDSRGADQGSKWDAIADEMAPDSVATPEEDLTWEDVINQAIPNLTSSAIRTGKQFAEPILHPAKTAESFGGLAQDIGMGGGAMPMPASPAPDQLVLGQKDRPYLEAAINGLKQRYGSVDNLKRTIAEDPVGVLVDMATIFIGGGKALEHFGAFKTGEKMAAVGAKMDPTYGLEKTAAMQPIKLMTPNDLPRNWWQSAAKLSTTLTKKQRDKLTKVALDNDITPTIKGVYALREKIDALNNQIKNLVDTAQRTGERIPVSRLFKEFDALEQDVLKYSGSPMDGMAAIRGVKDQLLTANETLGRKALTPKEAQTLKQTIYRELEKDYSKISELPAKTEAQMAVARAAKEGLEEIIPEIKKLNATEGELIDLHNAIERVSARIANRDLMGIGVPIKGVLGGTVSGAPGATAGLLLGIIDAPAVKSRLAVALNKLKRNGVRVNANAALSRLMAVQAGRLNEAQSSMNQPATTKPTKTTQKRTTQSIAPR